MPPDLPTLLAFDTSAAHCAVALLSGGVIVAHKAEEMGKGQAERLMPMIEEVLGEAGKGWSDLDAIGVGVGPGNFTGVRISVAAARGIALGLGKPAIGVTTFEALASGQPGAIRVTLDGRRNQIFWQDFQDGAAISDPVMTDIYEASTDAEMIGFLGDGAVNPDPAVIAQIAAGRIGTDQPRPKPLYLRSADAALPSEPPVVILS